MAHLQTTPTGRKQSSRSLVHSPPNLPRRLTFGSSKKEKEGGYGIVSASGFSAWRRGIKRGSTSTNKENASASTSTGTRSDPFNRGLVKKKGLGMGLEGTPARKRFKRDSKKSKTSMGTRSTPKASISRPAPSALQGSKSPSLSMSLTISSFTSLSGTSQSPIESNSSAAPPLAAEGDDTFAVGADTIIGEDVFGLTISIDADGTTRPWSPGRTLSATPPFETPSQWFEDDEMDEEMEFDRLVEWAEVDVPVDFGDETNDPDLGVDPDVTLQAVPQEIEDTEIWSEGIDPTRIWDITVPIRETSVLSSEIEFEESDVAEVDEAGTSYKEYEGNKTIIPERPFRPTPEAKDCMVRTPGKVKRHHAFIRNEADADSIEKSRGLNISRLGLGFDVGAGETDDDMVDIPEPEPVEYRDPQFISNDQRLPDDVIEPIHPENIDEVEEIDHTTKVRDTRSIMMNNAPLQFSSLVSEATSSTSFDCEDDPLGFMAAEKYIKRERPRWYRATSSPTPPPPSRRLTSLTYSPTPAPSLQDSPIVEKEISADDMDGVLWRGAWKGRKGQRRNMHPDTSAELDDNSRDNAKRGRMQVEKVFIEPEYHGKAKRDRDARIAHYKDLETNYKLTVEAVYF